MGTFHLIEEVDDVPAFSGNQVIGIGLWLGTAAACATAVMLTRMTLDRRRFDAWDYEWKLISTPGGGWANSGKTE